MLDLALFPYTGPTQVGFERDEHTQLRNVVSKRFRRNSIKKDLTPRLRERAEALVDEYESSGSMELMNDCAKQFPLAVISDLMGLPVQDWKKTADLARVIFFGDGTTDPTDSVQARHAAAAELREWLAPLIEERR